MLMKTLAHAIHENAVRHGWYEQTPALPMIVALIHSEWSESLEEARAGRPLVYKLDASTDAIRLLVPNDPDYAACANKPEGVAVELIDGVIRILDFVGLVNAECIHPDTGFPADIEYIWGIDPALTPDEVPDDVPTLIAILHAFTSEALMLEENFQEATTENIVARLMMAACFALVWVHKQGIDPLMLLLEKHEYNKIRPKKHNKQF